eukprot:11171421-Lingulodinium_polyedra.AAC.1
MPAAGQPAPATAGAEQAAVSTPSLRVFTPVPARLDVRAWLRQWAADATAAQGAWQAAAVEAVGGAAAALAMRDVTGSMP